MLNSSYHRIRESSKAKDVIAAPPPDVRKGRAFPGSSPSIVRGCASNIDQRHSRKLIRNEGRKGRAFPHIRRRSRSTFTFAMFTELML